jgi:hypothetical protein
MSAQEPRAKVDELAERLEALSGSPDEVAKRFWRLTTFVLRTVRWQPTYESKALAALGDHLRARDLEGAAARLPGALDELEQNLRAAERSAAVHGRPPLSHLGWLTRCVRFVAQAAHAVEAGDVRLASAPSATALRPLALSSRKPAEATQREADDEPSSAEAGEGTPRREQRLIELELAAIDQVMEAARSETQFLDRRRRLFESARRLLFDASAALDLEPHAVRERVAEVASEIAHANQLQATGLAGDVSLLHQARGALTRGDGERFAAALLALDAFSVRSGDLRTHGLAREALEATRVEAESESPEERRRSAEALVGTEALSEVERAIAATRAQWSRAPTALTTSERELAAIARTYLTPGAEAATNAALVAVDGLFDVGGSLSPVRVEEVVKRARLVAQPTQTQVLVAAQNVEDLTSAVVTDPRALLLELATGRLLTRKFVHVEEQKRQRTKLVSEVRVYVLDGSGSMADAVATNGRARVRDALLLAELATVLARYERGDRHTRVVLYYRYFTAKLGPLVRVASGREALAAMGDVAGTLRTGGTDIEQALLDSFELVRTADVGEAELSRAQIVLVTDGEAAVDEAKVREARERVGSVPVQVSVIALGTENPALRRLVARQRARGERAFYHHLDDEALRAIVLGRTALGPVRGRSLSNAELGDGAKLAAERALDELSELERTHAPSAKDELVPRLRRVLVEAPHALRDAAARDAASLAGRCAKWFPAAVAEPLAEVAEDDEAAAQVLATIAELTTDFGAGVIARQADAIELLERLLPDAGLTPLRYFAVVERPSKRLAQALDAVRSAMGLAQPGPK